MMGPHEPLLLSNEALATKPIADQHETDWDAALVPSSRSLDITLPQIPANRRDLVRVLADLAPIIPEHLVWTDPVAGPGQNATITVVRRDWLDRFVGDLERKEGRILDARTADDGRLFNYVSPRSRQARAITLGTWIAALLIAGTIFLAVPSSTEEADLPSVTNAAAVLAEPEFSQAGILAAINAEPFEQLPEGLVASISGKPDGSLLVNLNTQDPDTLRDLIAESGLLPGYRELSQARNPEGAFLATYGLAAPRAGQASTVQTNRVPTLRARDSADAIAITEQALIAYATQQNLRLGVVALAPAGEAALKFDVELSGPQENVLAAINMIERGSPPMRFAEWELAPDPAGDRTALRSSVRLIATLIVPWARQQ